MSNGTISCADIWLLTRSPGSLEKHTQGVRELTPSELSNLLAAVGADHSFSPQTDGTAPHDVTRRVESVIARQGQPLFRSRPHGCLRWSVRFHRNDW